MTLKIQKKSIHEDAKLGFFEIEANIPDNTYIPPFPFRANGQLIFPSGRFVTYVTLAELQNCDKSWYKIRNSWQFVPISDAYPYKKFIESLYQKRLELKQNGLI
jgi:hypothetical protein